MQNSLLGKSLVGQVSPRNEGDVIALLLHDTSTDQDINLNETLLKKLSPAQPAQGAEDKPAENVESTSKSPSATSPVPRVASPAATTATPMSAAATNHLQSEQLLSSDLASLKSLVPVTPPSLGEFFDVTVTLAASPSNFTVSLFFFTFKKKMFNSYFYPYASYFNFLLFSLPYRFNLGVKVWSWRSSR